MSSTLTPAQAQSALDSWTRKMIAWHFSPATGCDYWLKWAKTAGWDPRKEIKCFADIAKKFSHFDDDVLRTEQPERFVPKAYAKRPYNVFETGGTTGMPKQRVGWDDYKTDYEEYSDHYGPDFFPKGNWLMVGPTGPRRLRLAVEHLANYRGDSCYFVDLDPRFVKRLIGTGEMAMARKYQEHVIDQAATILRHRKITNMFTTPRLLENLAERMSLVKAGLKGVFVGGTTMTPPIRPLRRRGSLRKQNQLRSHLRQYPHGSRHQQKTHEGRQLQPHLLRAPAARHAPHRQSR